MRKRWLLLIAGLMTVASLGWFYQTFKYEPALSPAVGYQAQWLNPPPLYARVFYSVLNFMDVQPCAYELAGWQNDTEFVYRWTCGDTNVGVVVYDPQSQTASRLREVPANLFVQKVSPDVVLRWVRADGVRPVGYESITRPLMVKDDGLLSPDGRRVAITSRNVYGPEDVLVLSADDGASFVR